LYKDGNPEDTIYNKAYSVEPGRINRIGREANEFYEPCMSILWLTQPDRIPEIFEDDRLLKGGLAPRFISLHESAEIQEISWDSKVIDEGLLDDYASLFNELFDAYRLGGECEVKEDVDEEDANDTPWRDYWQYAKVGTEREVGEVMFGHYNGLVKLRNSELQDVQQFAARWTENAWRLALIFHAVKYGKNAHREYIELETCQSALAIMDWFSKAQMDILNRGRGREDNLDADVAKLYSIVDSQEGKRMTFGKLKDSHCYEPQALSQLVEKSKGKLAIEESGKTKKKREVVMV
jgi:hypothetical protein